MYATPSTGPERCEFVGEFRLAAERDSERVRQGGRARVR